jgi:hypothetical protein
MTCRKRRDDVETAGSRYCGNSLDEACLRAGWHPALRWPESVGWRLSGTWEPRAPMLTEKFKWKNHESESTDAESRGGTTRSSDEVLETGWSEGVV